MRSGPMVVVLTLLAVGCATVEPFKVTATSAKDSAGAFDCAVGVATALGYTPEQVTRESGFFQATRTFKRPFDETRNDVLTVLVAKSGGAATLQVTGSSGFDAGKDMRLVESSPEVIAAANQIAADCK